ncbi:DinB family protein [Planococcus sp. ISL-109]|uniref:DinB family protein n=1 Tax=Planococcus sp. ISL-109 TaxID=2819166 RepID=UPI001BE5BB2C|nr:DinB family protein [Planococcus sp. ISL-109]
MDRLKQFAYHKWASQRILEHVQELNEAYYTQAGKSSFPSIRDTIAHVIGVEKIWLKRMNGAENPAFEKFDVETVEKAMEAFLLLHAEMELYFASLTEESWQQEFTYRNMKGLKFCHSRDEMLFTVINHASYHRGQITSLLRQFDQSGIPLDYIHFQRKNR